MFARSETQHSATNSDKGSQTKSVRKSAVRLILHTGAVIGAIFVVTVLLAAMPGHNAPTVEAVSPYAQPDSAQQESPQQTPPASSGMDHSHMNMDADEKANESAAVHAMNQMDMNHVHGGSAHMHMTEMRSQTAADAQRASQIVTQLRAGIEKYRDYHVALNEGFHIFLPNIPQPEYHFTSYKNGFMAAWHFDPSQPTSLLYRKTSDGYELVGAMYTMPRHASEEQLNERVPLSIAIWHLHTNLCMPPRDQAKSADWTQFGLKGSIATQDGCDAAGGKFHPSIFGWMVHVYPYEDSLDKIFAMRHHD